MQGVVSVSVRRSSLGRPFWRPAGPLRSPTERQKSPNPVFHGTQPAPGLRYLSAREVIPGKEAPAGPFAAFLETSGRVAPAEAA